MAPKRPAAAASGSASDSSDGEADAAHQRRRRRHSPSPIPSLSRSKSPPPNLQPNAAALSCTPVSAGADFAAASDSDAGGRVPSPTRRREHSPRLYSDSDADGRAPSPSRNRERSPRPHSDSEADAGGRVPSPRRRRERSPRPHSDYDYDNSAAAAASEDDGEASPPPRSRRSSRVETSNIKPVRSRPMDKPRGAAAGSSQRRSKRRHRSPALPSAEHHKRPPRVWSPEDEITILRALIVFRGKKSRLPASIQDTSKIHSQIRGHLNSMASTTQLSDKIRRLKHKYKLLMARAKNGRDPDLPTEHERDVYELSKKVWGSNRGGDGGLVGGSRAYEDAGDEESNEEQEINESDEDMDSGWERRDRTNKKLKAFRFENGNGNAIATVSRTSHGNGGGRDDSEKGKQMYPYLWEAVEELSKEHPSGPIFRKAFGVLEKSKARAMEEKLRKFRMSEIRQQLRRMDLMKETVSMVLDALEGAD
uniref:Glabrous enhancer-binding protein-like DBD domain-containing protein n=1 Tax=Arundo donax TaxID=35708 RepID=A0A0A9BR30_ARUDO